jgi:hypothetical protein
VPAGPCLDLGAGASTRAAGLPAALAWEPSHTPGDPLGWGPLAPSGTVALALAWPGPGDLDPAQRRAWWSQLADRLAPGAVAAVRLDLFPGWHPLTALQDFARFHASRHALLLPEALDQVLHLARATDGDGHWHGWLHHLDALRRAYPDALSDLARDPLHPAELHQWAQEASQVGLRWVGDARGPHNAPWTLGPALAAWVQEEVSTHGLPLRGAQIADYAHHRHTRLALFVRGEPVPAALPADAWLSRADDQPLRWSFDPTIAEPPPGLRPLLTAITAGPRRLPDLAAQLGLPRAQLDRDALLAWQHGLALIGDGPLPAQLSSTGA